jgi:hypothetical protein
VFDSRGFNAALGLREAGRESEAACDAGVRERKPSRGCRRDTELGHARRRKNRKPRGGHAPERYAEDMGSLDSEMIENAQALTRESLTAG